MLKFGGRAIISFMCLSIVGCKGIIAAGLYLRIALFCADLMLLYIYTFTTATVNSKSSSASVFAMSAAARTLLPKLQ